ncbi:MAG: IMS domain-containing protein [Synechococcus sp.]|nr:IMS domain-containing protein [Synechococcus sp.]
MSPASDAQAVLRALVLRLERAPEQGFTADTLQARALLLQDSAELLSDGERRGAYEQELMALGAGPTAVPALEIASSREVAGLLLLHEAGQSQEAFDLACRALQPPQAPALGSGREADLSLLAGLACLAAAEEAHGLRHFESACRQLQQGLQLLQRMGQMPELRQRMGHELQRLTPYLVLDLVSRDLTAADKRSEGLALLEQLVQRRGGLEGDGDPSFSSEDFQAFIKQIRQFLTAQEQVELFSRWGDAGSEAADFLASIALTASGFAQRRPECIAAARDRLLASGRSGIEPLLANLHLLLGQVDLALTTFSQGASRELRAWAARQSGDPLAQLCAYCRDWLSRDVLPSHRDIEIDTDLDTYFSHREVIGWVEREDRRRNRGYSRPAASSPAAASTGGRSAAAGPALAEATAPFRWPPPFGSDPGAGRAGGVPPDAPAPTEPIKPAEMEGPERPEGASQLARLRQRLEQLIVDPRRRPLAIGAAALALLALLAVGAHVLRRPRPSAAPARGVVILPPPSALAPAPGPAGPAAAGATAGATAGRPGQDPGGSGATPPTTTPTPLTSADPSEEQMRDLLATWLAQKSAVLAGASLPPGLDRIARAGPIRRLEQERRADAAAGQTQTISVRIESLRIERTSPRRIALFTRLAYSDERRAADGRLLAVTSPRILRNLYVFGRDGDRWRLVSNRPAE